MLNMSTSDLALRATAVSESKTTRVFTLAHELRRQGKDIISLAVGEPDFETPAQVIAATRQALEAKETRYGPVAGMDELRDRIAREFDGYDAENIIITNGAKQALYLAFQALCNPGDEVILPTPCWVSFAEQIKMAGGRPVPVETAQFQIDPQAIADAITPRTKAILINSPNNPTGAVYSRPALEQMVHIAEEKHIYLISDEAYEAFTFDDLPPTRLFDLAADRDRIITVRSFSKRYNMTGFRVGYAAAHRDIIQGLVKLQSHVCGNVCTFAQYGAMAALEMDQNLVKKRCAILQHRRDLALDFARSRFECVKPRGAFYLFPDVSPYLKKNETSEDLAMRLLDKAGVALVPGEAFGGPGHLRLSFCAQDDELQLAFERIQQAL